MKNLEPKTSDHQKMSIHEMKKTNGGAIISNGVRILTTLIPTAITFFGLGYLFKHLKGSSDQVHPAQGTPQISKN